MSVYLVRTHFHPEHNEARLAVRPQHREWLARLQLQGQLVNAGPFADGSGALLVFDVPDEATLRRLLDQDPYPRDALAITEIIEWRPLFEL